MPHPHLFITGFAPFGGSPVNPSAQAAEVLARVGVPGMDVHHIATLPVVGGTGSGSACRALIASLSEWAPFSDGDVLVCLGESMRADCLHVERVAVNRRSYRIADNAGTVVEEAPVVAGGAIAHFSALPVDDLCEAARHAGVPCQPSGDAGTFLCNEILYHALELSHAGRAPRRVGFIHVPQLPEQAAQQGRPESSMPLDETVRGLRAALGFLANP
ncbi:MAG: pyroglutamyl-peptidase I [Planctomycetota bacterium]|nr:pyroglutamyl-peptidase I [Planctomycetota bacterium]MDA1105406.1 pyroglutamyl-peptidase I [Planctomycetota bacterium]